MDAITSKYVHFKSRKATCIERTGLRREIKRDLYEAAIVFGADVSAHADGLAAFEVSTRRQAAGALERAPRLLKKIATNPRF